MSDDKRIEDLDEKLDFILGRLEVLGSHARILERHAKSLEGLERVIRGVRAGIDVVIESQREANQLVAGIHSLWAKLDCVRPRDTPSSEFRVVGNEEG